ncbi:hypothetical protein BH10BDE1_BH10BDE1_23950 [soil metagenome]
MSHSSGSKVGARVTSSKAGAKAAGHKAKGLTVKNPIVIDEAKGLVFETEREMYNHFQPQIQMLESEVKSHRTDGDISEKEFSKFEPLLQQVIDDPDEIWEDAVSVHGAKVTSYVGHYIAVTPNSETELNEASVQAPDGADEEQGVYYVALTYAVEGSPRFVYMHFPSTDMKLVDRFRRGELIYDRVAKEVEQGAVEGDALTEGDALAVGLYKAMLSLRAPSDILEEKFHDHEELREETIEEPDEIWRSTDLSGSTLVTFVKQFDEDESDGIWYLAVTVEDQTSSSHALLFSFPTNDENLVDRYRHGENLQAEEVTQEASH